MTGVAVNTPLGTERELLRPPIESVLHEHPPLAALQDSRAGIANGTAFRRFLKRRKDAKLFSPAAKLALAAAGQLLEEAGPLNKEALGLFVAVGREPPDEGEAEASLVASHSEGRLSEQLLSTEGRRLYPPLLPLKTLPNMVLAHISIHLDICGENATWAGGAECGVHAMRSAYWAIEEGRCDAAIAGGADSLISLGLARDRLRLGKVSPPGQAAVMLLLESESHAKRRGANPIMSLRHMQTHHPCPSFEDRIGDCGAADAFIPLAQHIIMHKAIKWGTFEVIPAGETW